MIAFSRIDRKSSSNCNNSSKMLSIDEKAPSGKCPQSSRQKCNFRPIAVLLFDGTCLIVQLGVPHSLIRRASQGY